MINLFSKFFTTKYINELSKREQSIIQNYSKFKTPHKNNLIEDCQLIAVDFETSSLDFINGNIISMGFCPIIDNSIILEKCTHFVVKLDMDLHSENAVIHKLTDDQLKQGISQHEAFFKYLELTMGKVVIAHHHIIERNFIQALSKKTIGKPIQLRMLDTLFIAKRKMERQQKFISHNSLRLFNLRKEFGLPNYNAHNALEDAISTAELFLAQKELTGIVPNELRLKDLKLFNT